MNRATSVYIVVILVTGVGLWVILSLGTIYLTPPEDLSGRWDLSPVSHDSTQPSSGLTGPMVIEQSGRFFQLSFENGPQMNLQLADSHVDGMRFKAHLTGGPWTVQAAGSPGSNEMEFTITGPETGAFEGRRAGTQLNLTQDQPPTTTSTAPSHAQN